RGTVLRHRSLAAVAWRADDPVLAPLYCGAVRLRRKRLHARHRRAEPLRARSTCTAKLMAEASPDPVTLAQALIRCESITPREAGALTLLQRPLERAGFQCPRMIFSEPGTADVDTLYARFGSEGPNLCFAGHTDVVPPGDEQAWTAPPFAAEIRNGVL